MTDTAHARRRPLYRTVLSLAVAALVAAWLPFTVFYVSARQHKPPAQIASVTSSHGRQVVITRTSGGQIISSATGPAGRQPAQAVTPVTTHVS